MSDRALGFRRRRIVCSRALPSAPQLAVLIADAKAAAYARLVSSSGRRRLLQAAAASSCSAVVVQGFDGATSFLNGVHAATAATCAGFPVYSNGGGGFITAHAGAQALPYWCVAISLREKPSH